MAKNTENKCIDCAYFCYIVQDTHNELNPANRNTVRTNKFRKNARLSRNNLTCYRRILPDKVIQECLGESICPRHWKLVFGRFWQPYQKGIDPETVWKQWYNRNLTIAKVVIVLLAVAMFILVVVGLIEIFIT